jgi:uncharacterized protein
MTRWIAALIIFAAVCPQASDYNLSKTEMETPCSDSWYQFIDETVATKDDQGHGPDVGSDEWKSVIEFKLGIRDEPNLPDRGSEAWCRHIDQIVRERNPDSSAHSGARRGSAMTTGSSFNCEKVEANSIEEMICNDDELSELDRRLSDVYSAAAKKATNEHPLLLKAEQRGWIKGRNECWKADAQRSCVKNAYQSRIAALKAMYRLIDGIGPVRFICDENPANEVIVTFFKTDPATLIAERGDSVSLMYLERSGSGTKYQGRNETFWEHQGEASINWGYDTPQMRCKKVP